MNKACPLIMPL